MRPDPVSRRLLEGAGRHPIVLMSHTTTMEGRRLRSVRSDAGGSAA